MTKEEIKQICKTNKNIVKWTNNEEIKSIIKFHDNCKDWFVINGKVYFTFDETKCYSKQHNYIRVLKTTKSILDFAKMNGVEL